MQVEFLEWNFDMVQSYISQARLFESGRARAYVCQNISGQFRACIKNFL